MDFDNQRAFAAFEVKSVNSSGRKFSGWATTPATDRVGDTINSLGVKFKNPLVLLSGHNHSLPIGRAIFKKPTERGVEFEAEIPEIPEGEDYGSLRDRVNTAWGEIKLGLVRAVSIGFRALKFDFKENGGTDFHEIEVFELSTVAIPALPQAVITAVKSMNGLTNDSLQMIRRFDNHLTNGAVPLIAQTKEQRLLAGGAVSLKRAMP